MLKPKFTVLLTALIALSGFVARAEHVSDRLTVTVRGTGPDVVLIPGLACSNAVWNATATQLEKHYRLHVVQVAGFAGAPARGNAKGPILQPTVDALDAYIKSNHLKSPKIIGHSLGGFLGMLVALQHAGDVGKLMIVDSLPFFPVIFGAADVAAATPQAAMMRDMILNQSQEAYAEGQKAFLPSLIKSPEGLKLVAQWGAVSDKSVVARAMYEIMTTDLRPKLSEIKTPVTMLYPWDASTGFAQADTDKLYKDNYAALPNKKLVRIDNSYHFIMLDQPAAFAVQVEAFVK